MKLLAHSKGLTPLVVLVLLAVGATFGLTPEMTLEDVLTLIVTGGLVWLIPNKK